MRVVVTGATGFVGRHLVHELFTRDNLLILLGRDIEKLRSAFGEDNSDISLVETDYGKGLNLILEDADAVVHLSGLRWWRDKTMGDYILNNVIPTENLFSAAANNNIKNIIFISSIAVYNSDLNGLPFTENEDCLPPTHYGVSKFLCEKIAGYYNSEFGMKIKSLRIGQVVGMGEREGFMLSNAIGKAISGQALTIYGKGDGARDYVYIRDVVSAVLLALDHPSASGAYNISLGRPVTHLQLAEVINGAFGNSGNLVFDSVKAEDRSCQWMSCERARRELGWQPKWDLNDMFADLADKLESHVRNQ